MTQRTEREGMAIFTSNDPSHATQAVVQTENGFVLVDTGERPYTDNEGAVYDPEAFLEAVMDALRAGRGTPVDGVEAAFGRPR